MFLDVSSALRDPGTEYPFTHHEIIPPQQVLGDTLSFDDPIILEGTAMVLQDKLFLRGTMAFTVHAHCANCLEEVVRSYRIPLSETAVYEDKRAPKVEKDEDEEEDEDQLRFSGYKIDLSHLALTLAILEMPIRFLCKKGCKGFAEEPRDNNQQANASREELDRENPFAALQQLLKKDQEV